MSSAHPSLFNGSSCIEITWCGPVVLRRSHLVMTALWPGVNVGSMTKDNRSQEIAIKLYLLYNEECGCEESEYKNKTVIWQIANMCAPVMKFS